MVYDAFWRKMSQRSAGRHWNNSVAACDFCAERGAIAGKCQGLQIFSRKEAQKAQKLA
jgi:hypothetical protein